MEKVTNMREYRVSFFKKGEEKDEHLGSVIVDEVGISQNLTLVAKAFRQASPVCLLADKTITERI